MYTTGFLSRTTGITERTIRYYESLGLLKPCRENSILKLNENDIFALIKILALKISHRKLNEIRCLGVEKLDIQSVSSDLEVIHLEMGELLLMLEIFEKELNPDVLLRGLRMFNVFHNKYIQKR